VTTTGTGAPRPLVLAAVKGVHTLAWLTVEACVVHLLVTGLTGRSGPRVAASAAVVAAETAVFAGNGFRCPLTDVAERYGAEDGSVTDIFLPAWFAHRLPAIHAPLLVVIVALHLRNRRLRRSPAARATPG
jgi:hypothetical protein